MKNEAVKIFQKKKASILEHWVSTQMEDDALREDLMSNEDMRIQSEELLSALVESLTDANIENSGSTDFENIKEILASISISRAKLGYSPRETGLYVIGLKDALLKALNTEL